MSLIPGFAVARRAEERVIDEGFRRPERPDVRRPPPRGAASRLGADRRQRPRQADSAAFLGLGETDLTPAVQAALTTLLAEIDELRLEVGRLKARLNEAEDLADQDALTPLLNRRALSASFGAC